MALVLVLTASSGVLFGQVRRHTWSRRTFLTFCTGMMCIAAVISARSLVTTIPAAVPILYASVIIPVISLLMMLALPSFAGPPPVRDEGARVLS